MTKKWNLWIDWSIIHTPVCLHFRPGRERHCRISRVRETPCRVTEPACCCGPPKRSRRFPGSIHCIVQQNTRIEVISLFVKKGSLVDNLAGTKSNDSKYVESSEMSFIVRLNTRSFHIPSLLFGSHRPPLNFANEEVINRLLRCKYHKKKS